MTKQKIRFIKFCIVGGSGMVVNLGILFILVEYARLSQNASWLIAVLLSILSNFVLNNSYTYRDRKSTSQKETMQRAFSYYQTSLLVMIFNFVIYKATMSLGFQYMVAAFLGIVFSTFFNFILANKLVWRDDNSAKEMTPE